MTRYPDRSWCSRQAVKGQSTQRCNECLEREIAEVAAKKAEAERAHQVKCEVEASEDALLRERTKPTKPTPAPQLSDITYQECGYDAWPCWANDFCGRGPNAQSDLMFKRKAVFAERLARWLEVPEVPNRTLLERLRICKTPDAPSNTSP